MLTLVSACGDKMEMTRADKVTFASAPAGQSQAARTPGAPVESYWAAQKLIRSAELRIEVKDVQKAIQAVDSAVRQRGALLADSRLSQDIKDRRQADLTIRVPSDRFAEALAALRQIGDVKSETVKAQDVTKEYADLETRQAVKEQTVTRLRALLEGRTAKLADVLEVERELARAVTELEQLKGERRYYDQQVAISSITITLFDHATSGSVQFSEPIASALHASLGVLASSLSGLIYLVAFVLPWVALVTLLWWPVTRLRAWLRTAPRGPDLK